MCELREITFLVDERYPMCVEVWEPDTKENTTSYLITLAPEAFELMQYTGLEDRNGKAVYEGDVVRFNDGRDTYEVAWCNEYLAFGYREGGGFADMLSLNDNPEIIGNIYENPGLVGG